MKARWALAACVLIPFCRAAQDSGGMFGGVIQKLTCQKPQLLELTSGRDGKKPIWRDLKRDEDLYLPLADGDQVRCRGKGAIGISGGVKQITITDGQTTTIRATFEDLLYLPRGFTPAASRGGDDVVSFPPRDGRIRAREFAIAWTSPPGTAEISISLLVPGAGEPICCEGKVNGAENRIDIPAAVAALQAKTKGGRVTLQISGYNFDELSIPFKILSAAEEAQLEADLSSCGGASALLLHLRRAHIFQNWELYRDEAAETEQALAIAPGSPYLEAQCFKAENRAGNAARSRSLLDSLRAHQQPQ